ncbi:helix-turn-helix domain-containing protein [Asticcacaulis sp.]|uniref:helix-turn-helix transcriptional regulator n=1 Tax=Asticcacaulis sp. TaxID=1872648 RepID=UPI0026174C82|nr:helix-turn-helix domain-containing protein [Asticcacaulis sp.]
MIRKQSKTTCGSAKGKPGVSITVGPEIELVTPAEAAEYLKVSPRTLARWRITGDGPAFRALSPQVVRYDRASLRAWLEKRVSMNTLQSASLLRTINKR